MGYRNLLTSDSLNDQLSKFVQNEGTYSGAKNTFNFHNQVCLQFAIGRYIKPRNLKICTCKQLVICYACLRKKM